MDGWANRATAGKNRAFWTLNFSPRCFSAVFKLPAIIICPAHTSQTGVIREPLCPCQSRRREVWRATPRRLFLADSQPRNPTDQKSPGLSLLSLFNKGAFAYVCQKCITQSMDYCLWTCTRRPQKRGIRSSSINLIGFLIGALCVLWNWIRVCELKSHHTKSLNVKSVP